MELRLLLLRVECFRLNPRAQPVVYLKQYLSQTTGAESMLFGEEGLIGRRWGSKPHHIIVAVMYLGINQTNTSLPPIPQSPNSVALGKLLNHSESQFVYL